MDLDIIQGIKRKCSSSSQIKSSKRKRPNIRINILDLSDCTLLHILKFLDATSLYQLGETCCHFKQLVQDESLWIHADARNPPNNLRKIQFCWDNVTKKTKHLLMAGSRRSDVVISLETLILSNNLNNLTVLALEYQRIKYCKLKEFPSTLQELSLRHSYVPNHTDFFRFAQDTMINLKTLLLDHCQWFEAGSLMSICRYPELEVLSLYMCKKLGDDDISSVSLVGKFGFKKLKVVDLRFTGLGDLFLKTFYRNPSLQIIYFQSFPSTYRIERLQRKLDLMNGEDMRKDGYLSDDEANKDLSKRSFTKRFNAKNLVASDSQTINDDTMVIFNRLKATGGHLAKPKTFLYVYPYDECICGFFDKKLGTYGPVEPALCDNVDNEDVNDDETDYLNKKFTSYYSSSSDSSDNDDNDDWDVKSLQHKLEKETRKQKHNMKYHRRRGVFFLQPEKTKLCHRLIHDSCTLPAWCQTTSNASTHLQKWLYIREPRNDYEIAMLEHTDKHFKVRATRGCGKKNAECECGGHCEEEANVIVISRNENGSLIHFRPHGHASCNLTMTKQASKEDITNLIQKITQLIATINQYSDNESVIVIKEVLTAFDECLKIEDYFKYTEDASFVHDLWVVFLHMSRSIHQNLERVLNNHFVCFQDLLKQLERNDDVVNRKRFLVLFFKNLLCSSEYSTEHPKRVEKDNNTHHPHPDEKWNLPGPSGLQSRKRKHIQSKHKKRAESKNDSDSDTEISKPKPKKNIRLKSNSKVFDNKNVLTSPIYVVDRDVIIFENKFKSKDKVYQKERVTKQVEYVPLPIMDEQFQAEFEEPARELVNLPPPIWPQIRHNYFVEVLAPVNAREIPTNIKELSLRGYHVGDLTLDLLKEMELDLLDVTGTNVTFAGVQQFMMSNPQCRLIHEFACVCRPKLHF